MSRAAFSKIWSMFHVICSLSLSPRAPGICLKSHVEIVLYQSHSQPPHTHEVPINLSSKQRGICLLPATDLFPFSAESLTGAAIIDTRNAAKGFINNEWLQTQTHSGKGKRNCDNRTDNQRGKTRRARNKGQNQ